VESLLEQLSEKLKREIDDTERLAAAQEVAEAVIEALSNPNARPDSIKEAAIAALGDAIERAESAVAAAEGRLRGE
jgi:uncharacterized protein (DUF1778 family)